MGSGAWSAQHKVFTPDGLGDLLQSGGQTTFADAQGNTRLVIDAAGNATALSYDAFGLEIGNATTNVNHRYTGEYFDQESGLYHLRARDYDPVIGRFISMDEHPGTQIIPLTLNKYLYGNADPVNHIDPSGNFGLGGMSMASVSIIGATAVLGGAWIGSQYITDASGSRKFGIWDIYAVMYFKSLMYSFDALDTAVRKWVNPNQGHHTIPVYMCGHMVQELSSIPRSEHVKIHWSIANIQMTLEAAELYATRNVSANRSSVVLKTAQTSTGRANIAMALRLTYQPWWSLGTPTIGATFEGEEPLYVSGLKTSLPWCSRTGES